MRRFSPGALAAAVVPGAVGTWRLADTEEASLREAMRQAGLSTDGKATLAPFDPPWVLGPWRRNEVQVRLEPR